MRLLIITQKIDLDDDNLGFFHRWIEEFAKNCEQVVVIAQCVGEYNLPANVRVVSLGKELGFSKPRQLFNFYRALWREVRGADAVFVHMIPLWVVAGWPFYKVFHKKVYLWYVHRSVTPMLRVAERIVVKIFTASRESFRLPSKKVEIVGHGIDTEYFVPRPELRDRNIYRILTVGRIAPSKRIKEMILGIAELRGAWPPEKKFEFVVIGEPRTEEDKKYLAELRRLVAEHGLEKIVRFEPGRPYAAIATAYQKSDLFLNFSLTGSIDKAVLEAMACGCDVLVANEAFFGILPPENVIHGPTPQKLARNILQLSAGGVLRRDLRELVVERYDLTVLIQNIVRIVFEK
jgi:glycosyltransferase involved in cell wall biosynthesis